MSGNYDENYFMEAEDDMVDYLTKQAESSFLRKEESYEKVREGADKLLNLLVAGIGGAVLLLFNMLGNGPLDWVATGVLTTLSGWLFCVFFLLKKCITARERPPLFVDPSCLYYDEPTTGKKVSFFALKRLRIYDIENDMRKLAEIVRERALNLDTARYGTAISSVAGIVVALVVWFFRH